MLFRLRGPNLNFWSVIFETTPKQSLKITSKVVRLALNRTTRVFVVYWPMQKCVISDKQRLRSTLLNWTQSCNPNLCMYTHTQNFSHTLNTHTPELQQELHKKQQVTWSSTLTAWPWQQWTGHVDAACQQSDVIFCTVLSESQGFQTGVIWKGKKYSNIKGPRNYSAWTW